MTEITETLGLVLGRFSPLHAGHLFLMDLAFKENEQVVICIGSAQNLELLPILERERRIREQLTILGYSQECYRIVRLIDPQNMAIWPSYVKEVCGLTDKTVNTFYRSEKVEELYERKLKEAGFKLRIIEKVPFYYRAPDGFYRLVSSATEIRKIHKELNASI